MTGAPMIQLNETRVQKGRQKRSNQRTENTKDHGVAETVEANLPRDKITSTGGPYDGFARIADEVAEHHRKGYVALSLRNDVGRQGRQQQYPPGSRRSQQQGCKKNGIRRPQNRHRMRLKCQRKTDQRSN